jgi:hypothetical protein
MHHYLQEEGQMNTIKIAVVGLLALGGLAHAQPGYRQPGYQQPGYQQPGYRQPDPRQYGNGQQNTVDQVLQDLNRASQRTRMDSRDFNRVTDISRTLQQFQFKWAQGKFDKGKLDHAIETLQHLADSNRLPQQERSMFYNDANNLRQFRATRGGYSYNGGYGNPYPYGR